MTFPTYLKYRNNLLLLVVVQLLSCVRLFATPWTAARQASLSFTIFRSLLKLMSIRSVMPSNHLIFCHPLFLLTSIFLSIMVFSNEFDLHIRWPKYWSFSFSISPSNDYSGLISFRIDWFDLERVTGRKARGPQAKEIDYKCQTFFLSKAAGGNKLKWQTFLFPSLYKIKRRFLLKFCVVMTTPGSIWT